MPTNVNATQLEEYHKSMAQVVATITCCGAKRPVTRGELSIAFDAVRPQDNWKMPVDKVVSLDEFTKAMVAEAIVFFTGSVATFEAVTGTTTAGIGRYRVKAAGYYATCGA